MGIGLGGLGSGTSDIYSSLLGGGSGTDASSTLLTDYASIKNGSYGKMMKAYYAKTSEEEGTSASGSNSKTKNTDAASASAARKFYETATAMNSLDYSEDNIDELYDKVSEYIKNYNALMTAASKSENASVKAQADALNDYTYQNYKLFSRLGITMNSDRTLSINEDTFKKVDEKTGATNIPTLKTLFQGINSFADKAADRASKIYSLASDGDYVTSSKAKYAGSTGSYVASSSKKEEDSDTKTSDSKMAASASTLYKSLEKLSNTTIDNDHKDSAYDALFAFIKDYNALLKDAEKSENTKVTNQVDYLKNLVSNNKSAFAKIGITINSDKSLSIDEDKFKEADMSDVKSLFEGTYSFAEKMKDRINQIYRYASSGGSLETQTYTSQGAYTAINAGTTLDTTL